MKIRSKTGGASISINPRGNGGLSICQGAHHVLFTEEEWREVSAVASEILRDYSPSTATTPGHARIQRYVINTKEHNEPNHTERHQP